MNVALRKFVFAACGVIGVFLIAVAALSCFGLENGVPSDHACLAVVFFLLMIVSVLILFFEGFRGGVLLAALPVIGLAFLLRILNFDRFSWDYIYFLLKWYYFFQNNGGFSAVASVVSDYNVPYLYFLAFVSYFRIPDLYLIKLLPMVFDVILAWGCLRLVRCLRKKSGPDPVVAIAFGAALLLPTVVLNGSYWGQCDVVYGALAVHAVAMLLEGRNKTSVALIGLAFSFKLQAIFILPLWGVAWLAGKIKFRELLVFPAAYLIVVVPAVLLGRPFLDTILIYGHQMGEYSWLTMHGASIFQFLPYSLSGPDGSGPLHDALAAGGIVVAGCLVLALLFTGFRLREKLDTRAIFLFGVLLSIGVPFFLPHMHDRYFFLADVLTLCLACYSIRHVPLAVFVQISSLIMYLIYFQGGENYRIEMIVSAVFMLVALVVAVITVFGSLHRSNKADAAAARLE